MVLKFSWFFVFLGSQLFRFLIYQGSQFLMVISFSHFSISHGSQFLTLLNFSWFLIFQGSQFLMILNFSRSQFLKVLTILKFQQFLNSHDSMFFKLLNFLGSQFIKVHNFSWLLVSNIFQFLTVLNSSHFSCTISLAPTLFLCLLLAIVCARHIFQLFILNSSDYHKNN